MVGIRGMVIDIDKFLLLLLIPPGFEMEGELGEV